MSTVASRDLRNHTAAVLRQVAQGVTVRITVHGEPVADIIPIRASRKQFLSKAELSEIVTRKQADPGLREDLERLAGETTEELDPS
jgi:prevent-host-death family protein